MKKKVIFAFSLLMILGIATGCNETSSQSQNETTSYEDNHFINSLKLTRTFEGKKFTTDGIGEVKLASCTDGDTAKFFDYDSKTNKTEGERYAVRFIGVNTPESTAKIEPWGKAASVYVANILNNAVSLVLENDIATWGQRDNNGYRYLGFVWYKLAGDTDYKNLNLELVEKGYSKNQMFDDSSICPYRELFESADSYAASLKIKVHGELDPAYDYDNTIKEVTISECRNNYDEYGISDTFSGYQLRVEALVVGMIGDNMVLRDLSPNEETGLYAGMYAYLGYNTSLATAVDVGDVVRFYCRLTKFNNNYQFTDVKHSFIGKQKFEILAKGLTAPTEEYPTIDINPYYIDPNNISKSADLAQYVGGFIQTEVTVREIDPSDYDEDEGTGYIYYRKDSNNNMTVYSKLKSSSFVPFNMRVDGLSSPYPSHTLFTVGSSYKVTGYLASYYENYQIQLLNNTSSDYIIEL